MKADSRRLPNLLRDLPRLRAICVYGDDQESIRECARRIVIAEAGTADDPFRVTACTGDDRDAAASALASPCLTGGRGVVWVRHAGDRMLPLVEQALQQDEVLLVIEYGDPTAKSRLRGLVEKHSRGCALACRRHAGEAQEEIRSALAELDVDAAPGVAEALTAQAERQGSFGRAIGIEAALYAGRGGHLALEDVLALASADSAAGLERGLLAGLRGDIGELDSTMAALLADGTAPVAILRSALFQMQRLRTMSDLVNDGRSVSEAGRWMRPPVFGQEQAMSAILARWHSDDLARAAEAIWTAERRCKTAGVPQEAVCRATLANLARLGQGAVSGKQPARRD